MAGLVDAMLVVGSRNSSNSNRLRELAEKVGAKAYLIDDASMIEADWLAGVEAIGVTAGASAPRCWCSRSSRACASWAARWWPSIRVVKRTWCLRCRRSCASFESAIPCGIVP